MSIIRVPYESHKYKGALDKTLVYQILSKYGEKGSIIFDPMCGGRTVDNVAKSLGMFVISKDLKEGFDVLKPWDIRTKFDIILLHPPYWTAKKYSEDKRDLSNMSSYEKYLNALNSILLNSIGYLKKDGKIILIIGDIRKGILYPTHAEIMVYAKKLALELIDYELWELTATGTPFKNTKSMIMFNWVIVWKK